MKKTLLFIFFGLFFLTLTAFSVHKFYVAVYQINYAPEKKMLQITSRIFVDDLNKALEKKYNKKLYLGTEKESQEELILLKKYFAEKFTIKINGQPKDMNFLSKELEGDVVVCYWNIKDISKINSLETYNAVLIDWDSEQQNITHFTILGTKQSFLFTDSSTKQMLKF
ncbi:MULTISPECIES: DUF6702 family protein [unclassified Flavobacterium]|jgi:uncharacterized surface protein with fasciclin (FAS1) repeats|uniref:DUF6702 family protein n=1 Tax=unclassified Flavobacterium TaxID=196869 RepID=UPI0025C08FA8|nr:MULTISPECIES: DUF6702 family protein [unclassified Flavobacterium]